VPDSSVLCDLGEQARQRRTRAQVYEVELGESCQDGDCALKCQV